MYLEKNRFNNHVSQSLIFDMKVVCEGNGFFLVGD